MDKEWEGVLDAMRAEISALEATAALLCAACGQSWDCHYPDVCSFPVPEWFKDRLRSLEKQWNEKKGRVQEEEEEEEEQVPMDVDEPGQVNDERGEEVFKGKLDDDKWCEFCFQKFSSHQDVICKTSQELYKSVENVFFKGSDGLKQHPRKPVTDVEKRKKRSIAKGKASRRP